MKHKLLTTKDCLLLIDEEVEIKDKDYFIRDNPELNFKLKRFIKKRDVLAPIKCNKVTAYFPLTLEAKELDLPLLPNPFEEINVEKIALKAYYIDSMETLDLHPFKNTKNCVEGFIEGYKAAQSKQFSLEDIEEAVKITLEDAKKSVIWSEEYYKHLSKRIIQQLSIQQLPKEFIPEYEDYEVLGERDNDGYPLWAKSLKTITNSEGKQELVGTYKY